MNPRARAWLLQVTRPVLRPVVWSTLARWLALVLDAALFATGTAVVVHAALHPHHTLGWGWALLALALLSLGKASSRHLEQWLGHLVAFRALEVLRVELFARLWPQAPALSRSSRSGDVLERAVRDVDRIEVFFAHTIAPAVTAVLAPVTVLAVVAGLGAWPVALVGLVGVAVAILVSATWRAGRVADAGAALGAVRSRVSQHLTDTAQGLEEVVGYGIEQQRRTELQQLGGLATAESDRLATAKAERRALGLGLQLATVGAAVLVAAHGMRHGLDPVVAAAACMVVLRCFEAVRGVDGYMDNQGETSAAATRLYDLAHAAPRVGDPAAPRPLPLDQPGLAWDDVTYAHPGEGVAGHEQATGPGASDDREPAVVGVRAQAPAGRHTCVVGASGAGKSTLAQLALRFDDPTSGRVLLGDADVRELALDDLRRDVAMVAQHTVLFRASVADNLRLGAPDADESELWAALEQAGLADDVRDLPDGLDTALGERGRTLSGGQAQRLSLARALLSGARVLVLDEATAHLDPQLAGRVRDAVRTVAAERGLTVVEITHRVHTALDADHVVVLDSGRVVDEGTPTELLERSAAFRRLLAREG